MNHEIVMQFETGSRKVEVNLVRWKTGGFGIQITDGSSNFTSFDVDDERDGKVRGEFLAARFRAVA